MTALRAIWAVLRLRIPAWAAVALLIVVAVWGAHEWRGRQAAEIDVQRAIAAKASSEAAQARDRAVAAESAAEAVANSLRAQQDHAKQQQAVLDGLESKRAALAEWQRAYAAVLRGRDDDARGLSRLREQLSAASADADRRARSAADAATEQCLRATARALDALDEGAGIVGRGVEVAGRGAGLAVEAAGIAGVLDAELGAAARIIGNDRALMSRPHSQ